MLGSLLLWKYFFFHFILPPIVLFLFFFFSFIFFLFFIIFFLIFFLADRPRGLSNKCGRFRFVPTPKKKKKKKKKGAATVTGFRFTEFFFLVFFLSFLTFLETGGSPRYLTLSHWSNQIFIFKKKLGKTRYDSIFAWISWTGREISPKKNERNSVKLGRTQSLNQIFILKKNSVKLGTTRFLLGFHELEGKFRQKKKTKETR